MKFIQADCSEIKLPILDDISNYKKLETSFQTNAFLHTNMSQTKTKRRILLDCAVGFIWFQEQ